MPTVELLYAKDCPNVVQARANLARALTEVGLPPSWKELELSSPETPARLRRFGSPSVFVDGRDVASVEPGDAAACRVYEIEGDRRSGVPPIDLIARALTNAAREHRPARGTLGRTLFVLPGAALALVPSLTCSACWPTYAALLSALGVGFIPTAPYLFPLTALCLIVAVAAVTMTARQRGRAAPIIVALFAAVMILLAKFGFHVTSATYGGAALLVGASIWGRRPVPVHVLGAFRQVATEPHLSSHGRKEVKTMVKSVSLCPACDACPAVEIDEHEVRIGEAGNLTKLTPAEWNELVRAIRDGELTEL